MVRDYLGEGGGGGRGIQAGPQQKQGRRVAEAGRYCGVRSWESCMHSEIHSPSPCDWRESQALGLKGNPFLSPLSPGGGGFFSCR